MVCQSYWIRLGRRNIAFFLLLCGTILISEVSVSLAQSDGPPAVRVETREVVVPVYVIDKSDIRQSLNSNGELTYYNSQAKEITGLSTKDFHLYEDGKEQQVQNITVEPRGAWVVRDNVSGHLEQSCTPKGIWSSPDLWPQTHFAFSNTMHLYLISYVPPPSPGGSCHQIKVKVDHRHATVYARDEYCHTNNALSDPVYGTKLGKQLEGYVASGEGGKLPVTAQASPLFGESGANRVNVAIEFPWSAVKREWNGVNLAATVAVLGMIYNKDRALMARFSDILCGSPQDFYQGPFPIPATLREEYELWDIPSRYETQLDLPSGNYDLELVVTDRYYFGLVKVPLNIDSFSQNSLAISGIALCKRFHTVPDGLPEKFRAPQYIPLIANGLVFTPAGDTRFKKNERLMTYFEVYEPLLGGTSAVNVQLQMKVADAKTGELKSDTGLRPLESGVQPGNFLIPVVREIAIDKLAPGSYRLEVQASDSAGKSTVWRTAFFTVE
jgi:hypothetical protein